MKLIRQTQLVFQQGSSEKVYEVDLCEVGPGQYVVNFRYGRRGAPLKDGSKTVVAVPLREAEEAFDKLVASKLEQGYVTVGSPGGAARATPSAPAQTVPTATPSSAASGTPFPPASQVTPGSATSTSRPTTAQTTTPSPAGSARTGALTGQNARDRAVLDRLARGDGVRSVTTRLMNRIRGRGGVKDWPLSRAIWRAGELRLRAAVPLLLDLLYRGDDLRDYCIAWALGQIGDPAAIGALERLSFDPGRSDKVRRIATEALRRLFDERRLEAFRSARIDQLPEPLRGAARTGPAAAFSAVFQPWLEQVVARSDHSASAAIDLLYQVDNDHVRPALLELARTAPIRPPLFQRLRHLFKTAEYRRDGELFGILAYRLERTPALYRKRRWSTWTTTPDGHQIEVNAREKASPRSRVAYSSGTRWYLRSRVWRTLRRLGELGDEDYVPMAVGVLMPYTDADAQPTRSSAAYRRRRTTTVWWDAYAPYLAFNHVLYEHSPRYELARGTRVWRCRPTWFPGGGVPPVREEAFPVRWNETPAGLLMLLDESRCAPVHEFAARALGSLPAVCDSLDREAVLMLLTRPYEVTVALGFRLAQRRHRPDQPDKGVILAVAHSIHAPARQEAWRWIDAARHLFLSDVGFLADLATGSQADTRDYARKLLRSSVLPQEVARALIARVVAILLGLGTDASERAGDIAQTVLRCFLQELRSIGLPIIRDLLNHPLSEVQELGGELLVNHPELRANPPSELLKMLLESAHPAARGLGARLLGAMGDAALAERATLLAELASSAHADLRAAIRPVIQRLALVHPVAASTVVVAILHALLKPEAGERAHSDLEKVLREDLSAHIPPVPVELVLALVKGRTTAAQAAGGLLLGAHVRADDLGIDEITRLFSHDVKAVREAAWALFEQSLPRLRDHMAGAVRALDAKWEDSRAFAFTFFRERFTPHDLSPDILIAICDSVREDVQQFGRELITRAFEDRDGAHYLVRLSEHPSQSLQRMAAGWLERYAADDVERLHGLEHYFRVVLSQVNRGRVARQRVLEFLAGEGLKSETSARFVAGLLERQVATMAIGSRARMIEILVDLHRVWPAVAVPIRVLEPEVRRAV